MRVCLTPSLNLTELEEFHFSGTLAYSQPVYTAILLLQPFYSLFFRLRLGGDSVTFQAA